MDQDEATEKLAGVKYAAPKSEFANKLFDEHLCVNCGENPAHYCHACWEKCDFVKPAATKDESMKSLAERLKSLRSSLIEYHTGDMPAILAELDSIRSQATIVAEDVRLGCRPNWHSRIISLEEDIVGEKRFSGCFCSIADKLAPEQVP